jgi:SNF family Na+-dependent transporter
MQRGSVGALRGITPRLAGAGWAAAFSGFVTCVVYCILLGLSLYYMFSAGSLPWAAEDFERPLACDSSTTNSIPNSELYLYMNVTKVLGEKDCQRFEAGEDSNRFAGGLFVCVAISWVLCFLMVSRGVKTIQYPVSVTALLPFLFLVILIIIFLGINNDQEGLGIAYYFNTEQFAYPPNPDGTIAFQDQSLYRSSLIQDALLQVFFSVGVCYGVMFAYGSYNPTRKPVIADTFIIAFLDFVFAILSGFITFGAIGAAKALNLPEYSQTNSVGLTFILMPALAAHNDGEYKGAYLFFCLFLFIAGIDSAVGYMEAMTTNMVDQFKWNRTVSAGIVTLAGLALSAVFCTSSGWILFDLVDHYISSYIVIGIGLMQVISVGWLFEKESTAAVSQGHADSLKWMGIIYWTTTVVVCFYANFGFKDFKIVGLVLCVVGTLLSLVVSKIQSKMSFRSWYHEIVLCGVDKISQNITVLSNPLGQREWWMIPFEAYFGLCVKFVAPIAFTWLICENLEADLEAPYAEQPEVMQMYASIIVFITLGIIFGPMFICDYPEVFEHDVNAEFNADNVYAIKLRKRGKGKPSN